MLSPVIPKHKRRTLVDLLFLICVKKFMDGEWVIKKSLLVNPEKKERLLATTDFTNHVVTMHPKVRGLADPPLEQTLLHELLHLGLDLDEEWDNNGVMLALESYIWRRLTPQQKQYLADMLEEA